MATYDTFIDPADLRRAWNWIRRRLGAILKPPVTVLYDPESEKVVRVVNVLRVLDAPGRLRFVDVRSQNSERGPKAQCR